MQEELAVRERAQARGDETGDRALRRIILLIGAARSGTSWLATILNSYEGVFYCHEPFRRPHAPKLEALFNRLKTSEFSTADRISMVAELSKAHPSGWRPPFFRKREVRWPPAVRTACWYLAQTSGLGAAAFCRLFSPDLDGSSDLLIKDVDWALYLDMCLRNLDPCLIHIMRHPCAVVSSLLRGQRLGLMPREVRSARYRAYEFVCLPMGFTLDHVQAMDDHEFEAFGWLVQNFLTLKAMESHLGTTVVYEELSRDPLGITETLFGRLGWSMGPQTRRFVELSCGIRRSLPAELSRAYNRYFGIYKDSGKVRESWKTELTDRQIEQILAIGRRLPGFENYWPE